MYRIKPEEIPARTKGRSATSSPRLPEPRVIATGGEKVKELIAKKLARSNFLKNSLVGVLDMTEEAEPK